MTESIGIASLTVKVSEEPPWERKHRLDSCSDSGFFVVVSDIEAEDLTSKALACRRIDGEGKDTGKSVVDDGEDVVVVIEVVAIVVIVVLDTFANKKPLSTLLTFLTTPPLLLKTIGIIALTVATIGWFRFKEGVDIVDVEAGVDTTTIGNGDLGLSCWFNFTYVVDCNDMGVTLAIPREWNNGTVWRDDEDEGDLRYEEDDDRLDAEEGEEEEL